MSGLTVAFTVSCRRPKYLRATLDSWHRVRGVQDAHLLFSCEPHINFHESGEFMQFLGRSFTSVQVEFSDVFLNCLKNTRRALELAFAGGAEFVVVAEEDVEVATDTLEYLKWARDCFASDSQVAAVCSHARFGTNRDPAAAVRISWFNPLVWGTWKDRWESLVQPTWGAAGGNLESWDLNFRNQITERGLSAVFPLQSRALHIGEISCLTPMPLAEAFYKRSRSDCFAPDYPPQDYREISQEEAGELTV